MAGPGSRRWRFIALGGLLLASSLAAASPPASAGDIATTTPSVRPVTWVDGQGRQYTLTSVGLTSQAPTSNQWDLVIGRDLATGQPDPSWGSYGSQVGVRKVSLTPPAAVTGRGPVVGVDASGVITTTWTTAACSSATVPCDRWFQRSDVDGSTLGTPMLRTAVDPVLRSLGDGSVLTGTPSGAIGWRGADGSDRGAPDLATSALRSAAVDSSGRLLVASSDGSVHRWAPGGPESLNHPTGCDTTGNIAVGTSATDDSFVVACAKSGSAVSVKHYDAAGALLWSATDAAAPNGTSNLTNPVAAAIDSSGRAWVAGTGSVITPGNGPLPASTLTAFTGAGPQAPIYQRLALQSIYYDNGSSWNLRPVLGDHVAFADERQCCSSVIGPLPMSHVYSGVLPARPSPPTCHVDVVTPAVPSATTVQVSFQTCAAGPPAETPTGYRVEALGIGGTMSKLIDSPGALQNVTTTLTGLTGGKLLRLRVVPFNANGDSVTAPIVASQIILPFDRTDLFAARQYADLMPGLSWLSENTKVKADIADGSVEPQDLVASLLERGFAGHQVEPVARLYTAYFLRPPDPGGLTHWVAKYRGTKLSAISSAFARSHEFDRRYGKLSNRAFVAKLYENVFGRTADQQGLDFWTKRLYTRVNSRGQVVLQFSESTEGQRLAAPVVQPLAAAWLMLGRLPTAAERTTWAAFDHPRADTAAAILATQEYADHVQG